MRNIQKMLRNGAHGSHFSERRININGRATRATAANIGKPIYIIYDGAVGIIKNADKRTDFLAIFFTPSILS